MKKILPGLAALLLSVFSIALSYGQSAFSLPKAYAYLYERYQLDHSTIGDLQVVSHKYDDHNQAEHIYLTQVLNGYPIYGSSINLVLEKNGKLSSVGHRLIEINKITLTSGHASITAPEAIKIVAGNFDNPSRSVPVLKRTMETGADVYDKADISLMDIPVEKVYYPVSKNQYALSWKLQYQSPQSGILYQSYVDATKGSVIKSDQLTIRCSFDHNYLVRPYDACSEEIMEPVEEAPVLVAGGTYRALMPNAESPIHGTIELLNGIEDATASPFGWHDTNGVLGAEYTHTQGNNVHAFLDRNWDYASDRNVDGGANLTFDFPFNPDTEPSDNQDIAVTNLFVRNNFMHDFAFRYGFNEDFGNFQQTNYSTFGIDEDYVEALSQFGDNNIDQCGAEANNNTPCINNADFSTPADGFNGRMRMFTWNQDNSSKLLDVLQPAELAGKILTGTANFGPDISTTPVTGEVVLVDDGTSDASKGCEEILEQDLTGKIALIDRGLCDFSLKVYNAQNAGAIGAIICNFEDVIISMDGADNAEDVTIPSVFITHAECNRIRIAAGKGLVASLVAPVQTGTIERDGSMDNGIISHEYGHGISNRLTHVACLGGQEGGSMGEGWSDFFALVTTVHAGDTGDKSRGIGTYSIKENITGNGIRTYPYTTDMSVNPHTYDDIITEAESHGVGSVWCAMLWDMYWAFADKYGLDLDPIHGKGGNNTAIQLVMDGLKLQPCNPSFTDARDAILKADSINSGGANSCMIWNVFARRGLGVNAQANDPDSWSDGKEGFDVPKSCLDEVRFTKTMTPEIVAGDNITVTLKVVNYKDFPLTNVAVEDQIPAGTSYIPGSGNIAPVVGNSLVWTLPTLQPDEEVLITYGLSTPSNKNSVRLWYDDMENVPEDRWEVYFDPDGNVDNFWFPTDALVHSGVSAWQVGDPEVESQHYLQNFDPFTVSGAYPVYRFYHYYNTETGADGGFLEISTNGGDSWESVDSYMFRNRYPRSIQYATFVIPNLNAFSGVSNSELVMTPVYIDLSAFAGQDAQIRFRFGSDDNIGGVGWYVDDVELMDAIIYNSQACLTNDELNPICTEAPERGTIVDSQVINATEDDNHAYPFTLLPNPAGDYLQVALAAETNEKALVNIYSMTGQLVSTSGWTLNQGANQKTFDISRYAPGMYVLQVKSGKGMRSERFVKE